tara:strand:+ start:473 stop:1042 length:570 start_codon:yes stop_codon:yes gene_type:complete
MVSVRGQLDAPLLDIGQVEKEYWERKTVILHSLKDFNKPTGWRKFIIKAKSPKIIIKRLSTKDWQQIDSKFFHLKEELAKDAQMLRNITDRLVYDRETLTEEDWTVLSRAKIKALPLYIGMLELMIEEPKMDYSQVEKLWDCLDEYDRETLATYVNMLTSEKMSVAQEINKKRLGELDAIHAEELAKYG